MENRLQKAINEANKRIEEALKAVEAVEAVATVEAVELEIIEAVVEAVEFIDLDYIVNEVRSIVKEALRTKEIHELNIEALKEEAVEFIGYMLTEIEAMEKEEAVEVEEVVEEVPASELIKNFSIKYMDNTSVEELKHLLKVYDKAFKFELDKLEEGLEDELEADICKINITILDSNMSYIEALVRIKEEVVVVPF